MARPRAADYDDKRRLLLDEAARLFAAQGFARTPIEALAKACGASKSWLYHYYPSKEALLYDILRSHVEGLDRAATEAVEGAGDARGRLRALVRALMGRYVRTEAKHKVLLNDLAVLPPAQQAEIIALQRRVRDRFRPLVAELAPGAVARPGYDRAATMALMGMINFTYTWFDPAGPLDAEAYADLATDIFLGGIRAVDGVRGART